MTEIKNINDNHYHISGLNLKKNRVYQGPWDTCAVEHSQDLHLYFENGQGGNGLSDETLLEVMVSRLERTQSCPKALAHLRAALTCLTTPPVPVF